MQTSMISAYGAVLQKAYWMQAPNVADPAAGQRPVSSNSHARVAGGSFATDDQPMSIGRTRIMAFAPTPFHMGNR